MKELAEYRINLLKRLGDYAKAFREACLQTNDPYVPVYTDGWSVHQIAVHTRDVNELVYGLRARRTAVEENPEFPNFDSEGFMKANYNPSEPLDQVLSSFVENVGALVEWLQALPVEAWSRVSRHTTLGRELTLQSWVEKDLAHIEEHLKTVKKQNQQSSEQIK
jgi:DinB superfamily